VAKELCNCVCSHVTCVRVRFQVCECVCECAMMHACHLSYVCSDIFMDVAFVLATSGWDVCRVQCYVCSSWICVHVYMLTRVFR